ncbi:MAG: hypothetical protein CSA20_05245 [Deltaproteobacteria bacterium]|nr:MAG: hypothetical protein CSA20_05245 [Deltaproteobacteria bacterium]
MIQTFLSYRNLLILFPNKKGIEMNKTIVSLVCLIMFAFSSYCSASGKNMEALVDEVVKSAKAGDSESMHTLGDIYYNGTFFSQDYKKAIDWYTKAAEAGAIGAMYNLGLIYGNGKEVPQDYKKAVKWYTKAAEAGDSESMHTLGDMYYHGTFFPQDYKKAVKWYTKAAEAGAIGAMYNLGRMWAMGKGVPQDYIKAYMWFNLAAVDGDSNSTEGRRIVAKGMTVSQIEEGQRLTREWLDMHPALK